MRTGSSKTLSPRMRSGKEGDVYARGVGTIALPDHSGRAAWLPLLFLVASMWLLSGCVVTPIAAQQGRTEGAAVTIAVAPITGGPGVTIFVSGAGWLPAEVVYVNLEAAPDTEPVQTTVAIATADAEGRFTASFPYPLDPRLGRAGHGGDRGLFAGVGCTRHGSPFEVDGGDADRRPPPRRLRPARQRLRRRRPTRHPPISGLWSARALNVRSGPSIAFPVKRSIARGTEFLVLGQNSSGAWLLYGCRMA